MAEREEKKGPSGGSGTAPPREAGPRFGGLVCIEITMERNRPFLWPGTNEILRGVWSRANLKPDELVEEIVPIPDLPGMRIEVDGARRILRVYDPLSLPEFQAIRVEAARLIKAWDGTVSEPTGEVIVEEASDGDIKTWLHYMRRLVNGTPRDTNKRTGGPQAIVVAGTGPLPTAEEIARMPGRIRIGQNNASQTLPQTLEGYSAMLEKMRG